MKFIRNLFGTKHQRDIRALRPMVARINEIEEQYQRASESEIKGKTAEFRKRLADGETLDGIMCDAFAVVKNACRRLKGARFEVCGHELMWDMVPFDVQLMGGIALHKGNIAEMATGEGKTLVATLPLYLNALSGRNVHLVTVNDYLARRDAQWMGQVYRYLGLTVGCIQNYMGHAERREQYSKDITYGTNSEFGFDYLRDNGMSYLPEGQVQRGHYYAIIDEVDSILIDEARTPLIISGPVHDSSSHEYNELRPRVEQLVKKQRALCNELMEEAKRLLEKGDAEQAQLKLYQVHQGMPKHKQLMHILEDPSARRLHEQIQNAMLTDMRKEQGRELREELYFTIDERGRDATLTEMGCEALNPSDPEAYVLPDLATAMSDLDGDKQMSDKEKMEKRLALQEMFTGKSGTIHTVDQLIRAYCLYERDVEYVIQNNQVLIVDEFTGRILPGRRWSDGLHQAIEAKEGVQVERETQTLATITIQNYFRMYDKLSGMTGTAETEATEFHDIYKLDVVTIPTNRPVRRVDYNDVVYKTQREKFKAVIDEITECYSAGQPVLVGTVNVDTSELISRMLRRVNIPHNVLNAKNHEKEAEIVMRAGQKGAITIATNMAGRGTDIKLGEGVVHIERSVVESKISLDDKVEGKTLRSILLERPAGLHVIGSERHESRRIDRQLRGRCARQGDPGSSRFYVSLEDDLMRLFGSDRIANIMSRLGLKEGEQLEHRWLNRSIETAQRRVEQQNYSIRKRTLEYDDVMNRQREVIYEFRGDIVRSADVRQHILDIIEDITVSKAEELVSEKNDGGLQEYAEWVRGLFPVPCTAEQMRPKAGDPAAVAADVFARIRSAYELKVSLEDPKSAAVMERHIVLTCIDNHWQDYLRSMDDLRQGVGLRAYGQRDPLMEYKREAYTMFEELMNRIKLDVASAAFRTAGSVDTFQTFLESLPKTMLVHDEVSALDERANMARNVHAQEGAQEQTDAKPSLAPVRRNEPKVGRNDPCPCGSGKKYKKCCGA